MTSSQNTENSTPRSTSVPQPFTRVELVEKYQAMPISDALVKLPADMAYQAEWVKRKESSYERAKAEQKRAELIAFEDWTKYFEKKPTVAERETKSKRIALELEEDVLKRRLDLELTKVAYDYLENTFLAMRKMVGFEQ